MSLTFEALGNLFRKPFTRKYPKEKVPVFRRFRGKLEYHPKKCIGCKRCVAVCPSVAIRFIRKGKIEFNLAQCMQCGLCVDTCPAKAITWSHDFETAGSDREKLVVK